MRRILRTLLVTSLPVTSVYAASPVVDVNAAPVALEGTAGAQSNAGMVQLLMQVQRLQAELQALRGEVELQTHILEGVRKRQRDLYLDMDRRLHRVESGSPTSVETFDSDDGGVSVELAAPNGTSTSGLSSEEADYQEGYSLLKEGQYGRASSAFKALLLQFPAGKYAANAQYWLAESSYVTRNFEQALIDFKVVVDGYSSSNKVADALLKIGYIQYEKTAWADSRMVLEDLRSRYPKSSAARLAGQRLERMRQEGR